MGSFSVHKKLRIDYVQYYNKVEICGINTNELKVMSEEEKIELLKKAHAGDMQARDRLIEGNLRLVLSVVQRFANRGENMDDLFQVGVIGLIKAIDNFNLDLDVRFSTYAVPMIMGEIKRFLRDDGMVKVSRTLKETASKGRRARELLQLKLGREPTVAEIAAECGISEEEISEAFEAAAPPNSIYESVFSGGGKEIQLMDTLAADSCEDGVVNKVLLKELLEQLSERERLIITLRYFRGKTQAEISEIVGVSQVQISRIEKKAMERLRKFYE